MQYHYKELTSCGDGAECHQNNQKTVWGKAEKIKHKPGNGEPAFGIFVPQSKSPRDDPRKCKQDREHHHHDAAAKDHKISRGFIVQTEVKPTFHRRSEDDKVDTPNHENQNCKNKRNRSKTRRLCRGLHNKLLRKIKLTSQL